MAQLLTCITDHLDRWNTLVSALTVDYNTRPQQSTGVALFEVLAPEKVRKFALARLPESQYPKECKETA